MIPDFKTYIKESIWSDIQKRSMGKQTRKEDMIDNSLDFPELFEYIKTHYKTTNRIFEIGQWRAIYDTDLGFISIPIEKQSHPLMLTISQNINSREFRPFQITKDFFIHYPEIQNYLGDKYKIEEKNTYSSPLVSLKEGEITNQTCIELIDKLLALVKNPLTQKIK